MQCHLKLSAVKEEGVKIQNNMYKKICFSNLVSKSSGLKHGGIWHLQLLARSPGVNS